MGTLLTIDEYFFCINPCKFETLAPKSLCSVHVPLQHLKYQAGFSFLDFMVNCFDWHQMNFGKKTFDGIWVCYTVMETFDMGTIGVWLRSRHRLRLKVCSLPGKIEWYCNIFELAGMRVRKKDDHSHVVLWFRSLLEERILWEKDFAKMNTTEVITICFYLAIWLNENNGVSTPT